MIVGATGAVLISMESAFELVLGGCCESATCGEKYAVPAVVGVPLITPAALSDRPFGRLPERSDHV